MYFLALIVGLCQCITHDWLFDINRSWSTNLLFIFTVFNSCYLLLFLVICYLLWLCIAIICYQHFCYLLFIVVICCYFCHVLICYFRCDLCLIIVIPTTYMRWTRSQSWPQRIMVSSDTNRFRGIFRWEFHISFSSNGHAWVYASIILKLDLLSTLHHYFCLYGQPTTCCDSFSFSWNFWAYYSKLSRPPFKSGLVRKSSKHVLWVGELS